MTEILSWIQSHWDDLLAIYGGIVAVATVVVKLTPTQKDDAILAKIVKIFDIFSTVNPNGTEVVKK